MPKPIIDLKKCTGCEACVSVCPMEVFEMKDGKAVAVRPDDCIGCRACEVQCPAGAIKIED